MEPNTYMRMSQVSISSPRVSPRYLKREKSLGSLPYDLVKLIFSHLNEMDIEQASKVNKSWNVTTVEVAKTLKFVPLKSFVEWLIENLDDKFSHYQNWLAVALNETKISTTDNLLQVRSCKEVLSEKVLHILKEMGADDLADLECLYQKNQSHPRREHSFKHFFTLAEEYKKIDTKLSVSEICRIISTLVKLDASNKALECFQILTKVFPANENSIDWKIQIFLSCLFQELILSGKFTKAFGLFEIYSESLSTKFIKLLFCDIINSPMNCSLDPAMKASIKLLKAPIDDYVESAILHLFEKSCQLALTTPDFQEKHPTFVTFFEELLFCNEPALRLAAHDSIEQIPDTLLFKTFQNTLEKEKIIEAGKLATGLTDPLLESKAADALEQQDPSWPHLGSL